MASSWVMMTMVCPAAWSSLNRPTIPLPEVEPKVRQPNSELARQRLGWEPQVDVERALELTIAWFQEAGNGGEA